MRNRNIATAAVIVTAAASLVACGPSRQGNDAGTDSGTGCVGLCNQTPTDAGQDGGNNQTDGGTDGGNMMTDGGCPPYDGGIITADIQDLRTGSPCEFPFRSHVQVDNAVVHTVHNVVKGSQGDYIAEFWVSDQNNPQYGIWVRKFYTDPPGPYLPKPGDLLFIDGYFGQESHFDHQDGYRRVIKSQFDFGGMGKLVLDAGTTVTPPTPIAVQAGSFGNADGGWARPNADHAGALVYIGGPLEIVDPSPKAFQRQTANPNDSTFYGFEVTGGILVNNSKTFRADGGCPWRDVAMDAGTQGMKVVFQGGIEGVWDTWTTGKCADGGTDVFNCFKSEPNQVPGTTNDYTYVIYPQDCGDFIDPQVVPQ